MQFNPVLPPQAQVAESIIHHHPPGVAPPTMASDRAGPLKPIKVVAERVGSRECSVNVSAETCSTEHGPEHTLSQVGASLLEEH